MFFLISWKIIITVRFGDREIAKEKFYATKRFIKTWDVNVDNIVISKLVKKLILFVFDWIFR